MQTSQGDQGNRDRPGTPPRPPYSPVTPVFAHLAPIQNPSTPFNGFSRPIIPPATSPSPTNTANPFGSTLPNLPATPGPSVFAPEPSPVPISESENPDAIALRSAISILQLQKQQSLRDIQTLEKLKTAAAADPEKFAHELAAGKLTAKDPGGFINFHNEDQEAENRGPGDSKNGNTSDLGTIPTPQNVVRMPPINWAKYQVVGESLDKIHEDQQRRPSPGEPRLEETAQAPEHVLASPYRPLVDKLESPTKVKGINKNKKI